MQREKMIAGTKKTSGGSSSSEGVQPELMTPEAAIVTGNAVAETPSGDVEAATESIAPAATEVKHRRQDVDGEGEGVGDEEEEEEETDEEGKGFDQFDHLQIQEIGDASERAKLADGYYEIEAVRKKRSRKLCNDCDLWCDVYSNFVGVSACGLENSNAAKKGELQYLIKWRGWPETANTWEPLENLQSCTDVIDAFEESLQSGKQRSSRRRKRKYGGLHTQTKKKQLDSPSKGTYNVPAPKVRVTVEPVPFALPTSTTNEVENTVDGVNNVEMVNQATENTLAKQSPQRAEETEVNLRLGDLKGTFSNSEANGDKFAGHVQAVCMSEGDGSTNDLSRIDGAEPAQAGRCVGAKRRKSGFVKRFKQDSAPCKATNEAQSETARLPDGLCGSVGWNGNQNTNLAGNELCLKNTFDNSKNLCSITKIIRPVRFTPPESETQEVSVAFMTLRSDGKEVEVDNKFLKANNPLLLINYYEQHLRYPPTLLLHGGRDGVANVAGQ